MKTLGGSTLCRVAGVVPAAGGSGTFGEPRAWCPGRCRQEMEEDSQGKSSRVLGAGRHGSGEGGEAAMDLCMEKGLENSQNRYLPAAADS
jgi:hypothetical protein